MTVDLHHAETHLAELIAAAEAGEEVLIARGDRPVVTLTVAPLSSRARFRELGRLRGKLNLPDDWEQRFDAMDEELTSLMCDAPLGTEGG